MSELDDMLEELEELPPLDRMQRIRELIKEARSLPPAERIKRIKALEAAQRKALDEAKEDAEEELEDIDEYVRETEEELELALSEDDDEDGEIDLEERLSNAPELEQDFPSYEQPKPDYSIPNQGPGTGLYDRLQNAAENLDRLYKRNDWSEADVALYKESKSEIQKAQGYKLDQDFLREELGLANDMLNRLQYKN